MANDLKMKMIMQGFDELSSHRTEMERLIGVIEEHWPENRRKPEWGIDGVKSSLMNVETYMENIEEAL